MMYFDAGATTLQKPPQVAQAVAETMGTAASAGRGGHEPAERAAAILYDCREAVAELFHVDNPEQVVFTSNATHGLNLAIKSLVRPDTQVVVSGYEHNAVARPLYATCGQVQVVSAPLFDTDAVVGGYEKALQGGAQVAIVNHVSNVFGFVQPVEEIAKLCKIHQVPLIVDASQSAGVIPLDMTALEADFIAMPGHKGLYGPQGTGVLLCGNTVKVKSLLEGGTGSDSELLTQPTFLPDALEAGTHNICGLAGLLQGVRYVQEVGQEAICLQERQLAQQILLGLRQIPGVAVYGRPDLYAQTGVVSFLVEDMDCEEMARALAQRDMAVRGGLHCAPMAHKTAGTFSTGTVRISLSTFNTAQEGMALVDAVRDIVAKNRG